MPERKTIPIAWIVKHANGMLRNSVPEYDKQREGVASLLEDILMEANAYHGYNDMTITGAPEGYGKRRQYYGDTHGKGPTYDVELHSYACGCAGCTASRLARA